MLKRIVKGVILCFAVSWAVVIFTGYWYHNPGYYGTIKHFQYYDLLVAIGLIGGLLSWGVTSYTKKKKTWKYFNGLSIVLSFVLADLIIVSLFYAKALPGLLTLIGLFTQLGYLLFISACTFSVFLVCYSLGQTIFNFIQPTIKESEKPVIQIALGFIGFIFLLFLLGAFGLLKGIILVPLMVTILGVDSKQTLQLLRNIFLRPIPINAQLNAIGIYSSLFLGLLVLLNSIHILRISPAGFDAMTLYVKLPNLIHDHEGLVAGYQPYYWSLLMSVGLVAFQKIEVVLSLSGLGGLLSLYALFHLSRRWLDINFTLLALVLFYSAPLVHFQAALDLKTDLGLLFFLLCTLILFFNWMTPLKPRPAEAQLKEINEPSEPGLKLSALISKRIPDLLKENKLIALMGLFVGFALGIKLTALIAFLSLIIILWYVGGNSLGFATAFCLVLFGVLFLRLDDVQLLRQYHLGAHPLQWTLLIAGLGGLFVLWQRDKRQLLKTLQHSILLGSFFLLPVLPWFVKNYSETKALSSTGLLNGAQANPRPNIDEVERIWKEVYLRE